MNRDDLLDNLRCSDERRELVTLTLHPTTGVQRDVVVSGRILALAEHYTSRRPLQVVLRPCDPQAAVMVIGLTMIRDFSAGGVPPRYHQHNC